MAGLLDTWCFYVQMDYYYFASSIRLYYSCIGTCLQTNSNLSVHPLRVLARPPSPQRLEFSHLYLSHFKSHKGFSLLHPMLVVNEVGLKTECMVPYTKASMVVIAYWLSTTNLSTAPQQGQKALPQSGQTEKGEAMFRTSFHHEWTCYNTFLIKSEVSWHKKNAQTTTQEAKAQKRHVPTQNPQSSPITKPRNKDGGHPHQNVETNIAELLRREPKTSAERDERNGSIGIEKKCGAAMREILLLRRAPRRIKSCTTLPSRDICASSSLSSLSLPLCDAVVAKSIFYGYRPFRKQTQIAKQIFSRSYPWRVCDDEFCRFHWAVCACAVVSSNLRLSFHGGQVPTCCLYHAATWRPDGSDLGCSGMNWQFRDQNFASSVLWRCVSALVCRRLRLSEVAK